MKYNDVCRNEIYRNNKYLFSKLLYNTLEEKQVLNINLNDFGRIRTFKRNKFTDWNLDPIPIDIVSRKLNIKDIDELDVQMIEVAKCNLHCWWCYLPDEIRKINKKYMKWFSVSEMLDMIMEENKNIKCLYISGGNPELVPEVIYDTMKELEKRNLSNKIFLWSDDVLSTDYLFNMDIKKIKYMINYKNYAKVCCLKGFDDESYKFNTLLNKEGFNNQLIRLQKYIELGFDVYCYVIFTCENTKNAESKIEEFIYKLQRISYYLPLRVIPIKIEKFSAVLPRLDKIRDESINNQYKIVNIWNKKISEIYTKEKISKNISELNI